MKSFWSWLAKILLVITLVEGWFIYTLYNSNQDLVAESLALESKLLESEQNLSVANQTIEKLEKNSIEGILKETNKAVISGWEQLLDTVEEELEKARESISTTLGNQKDSSDNISGDNGEEGMPPESEEQQSNEDELKPPLSTPVTPKPTPQEIQGERT